MRHRKRRISFPVPQEKPIFGLIAPMLGLGEQDHLGECRVIAKQFWGYDLKVIGIRDLLRTGEGVSRNIERKMQRGDSRHDSDTNQRSRAPRNNEARRLCTAQIRYFDLTIDQASFWFDPSEGPFCFCHRRRPLWPPDQFQDLCALALGARRAGFLGVGGLGRLRSGFGSLLRRGLSFAVPDAVCGRAERAGGGDPGRLCASPTERRHAHSGLRQADAVLDGMSKFSPDILGRQLDVEHGGMDLCVSHQMHQSR